MSSPLDNLQQMMMQMELNSGRRPTITVGDKGAFRHFLDRTGALNFAGVKEGVVNFPAHPYGGVESILGIEIHEDTTIPYQALVIETLQDISVFNIHTGKGIGAKKDAIPYQLDTPESRTAIIYTMLKLANERPQ